MSGTSENFNFTECEGENTSNRRNNFVINFLMKQRDGFVSGCVKFDRNRIMFSCTSLMLSQGEVVKRGIETGGLC